MLWATKPMPAPQQEKPLQREACAPQPESSPLTTTREEPEQKRRPSTAKNKKISKKEDIKSCEAYGISLVQGDGH